MFRLSSERENDTHLWRAAPGIPVPERHAVLKARRTILNQVIWTVVRTGKFAEWNFPPSEQPYSSRTAFGSGNSIFRCVESKQTQFYVEVLGQKGVCVSVLCFENSNVKSCARALARVCVCVLLLLLLLLLLTRSSGMFPEE